MKILMFLTLALLAGCGTTGMINEDADAAYFMISEGQASGSLFSGNIDYCKVTQANLGESDFLVNVNYAEGSCTVEATSSAKSSP